MAFDCDYSPAVHREGYEGLILEMEQYNDIVLLVEESDEYEPKCCDAPELLDFANDVVESCSKTTSLSVTGTKASQPTELNDDFVRMKSLSGLGISADTANQSSNVNDLSLTNSRKYTVKSNIQIDFPMSEAIQTDFGRNPEFSHLVQSLTGQRYSDIGFDDVKQIIAPLRSAPPVSLSQHDLECSRKQEIDGL